MTTPARPTARDRRLLTLYGITAAEYDAIFRYQAGRCAICRRPPKRVRLGVDHRHVDGHVRGLLCMRCNKAVAYLADEAASARAAMTYLAVAPADLALGGARFGRPGRSTRKWRTKRERRERLAWVAARVAEVWPTAGGKRRRVSS